MEYEKKRRVKDDWEICALNKWKTEVPLTEVGMAAESGFGAGRRAQEFGFGPMLKMPICVEKEVYIKSTV